ncbi:MAG: guanylate kinase, partial [Ruminococcus sp.]|nr:guanylate kinase [Ruminococcus sp.]
ADHYYGTPRSKVEENLAAGKDVILEIETKGAFQVKERRSDAILLFILPPSVKELDRRLHKRGTETEEVIRKRLDQAVGEIKRAYEYDYVIMNDELEDAVRDFETVINAERNKDGSADRFRADNEDIKNMIGEVLDNA